MQRQKSLTLILRSVQGRSWCETIGPVAGSLGTWWHPMQCYSAKQARLCALSQHFSPPEEQTVSAMAVGAHSDGGGVGKPQKNGKESVLVLW